MSLSKESQDRVLELRLAVGENYSKIAQKLMGEKLDPRSHRTIRKDIADFLKNDTQTIDTTSVSSTQEYSEDIPDRDSLKSYCKQRGIDFRTVRSAKYINHQGQDTWNVVVNTADEDVDWDERFDKLAEKLENIDPVALPMNSKHNKMALHVYTSDKHVGAKTKKESLYKNEYDASEFHNRMQKTLEMIVGKAKDFGVFDRLMIFDLGDGLDGYDEKTTRGGHRLPQNMTNEEAFDTYVTEHCALWDSVVSSNVARSYGYWSVCNDNHSGSFGYTANRAVEIYLNAKYPEIKTVCQKAFIDHYTYGDHSFMLTHGKDKEDRKFGLPKALDDKTINFINQYIEYHNIKGYKHFIKGDLHQEATDFCNTFRYRNVLSMYGASAWIHSNFGWSRPGVSYEVIPKKDKDVMQGLIFM